jgi:hypothetical protein
MDFFIMADNFIQFLRRPKGVGAVKENNHINQLYNKNPRKLSGNGSEDGTILELGLWKGFELKY